MGSSYRDEIKRKKARSGYAAQTLVREGTAGRAAVREQYFRKSLAGRRSSLKAEAQRRMM